MFKNIRKCLDEFENATNKVENGEKLTREEDAAVWYFNLRLAEAMMRDGGFAENVAAIILSEKGMIENIGFKFNNDIAFKKI